MGRRLALAAFALLAALAVPGTVLAHPLGNFTINTYVGLRVSPADLRLDVVVDYAEVPTFEERLDLDADEDGSVTPAELAAAREPRCRALAGDLALAVDGGPVAVEVAGTGLRLMQGAAAGAQTLRLVCEYVGRWPGGALPSDGARVSVVNAIREERLGWREVVVEADGVTVSSPTTEPIATASVSSRLTAYPEDRLAVPLDTSSATFTVSPGGSPLPPLAITEVTWRPGYEPAGAGSVPPGVDPSGAVVPGGVASEIPEIFRAVDLSPGLALLAVGTALVLGAGHALTPGHGKTLMAAYLVGTRGTAVHAAGLGLSVTFSHTAGILALALLITGAQAALPPDVVVRALPTIAALTIVAIGAWMLATEIRRRRRVAAEAQGHGEGTHGNGREDVHGGEHDHASGHGHSHEHSHGGIPHSHGPASGSTITWRSLFTLGLAGGLIPSTSALVILLGTIASGRTAFGVVLVVAFGLGMAIVMGGIGVLLVAARGWLDRMPRRSSLGRLAEMLPLLAALAVLGIGLWLAYQGVAGQPTL